MKFYKIDNDYGILIDGQIITTERSIEYITKEKYILATGEDVPIEEVPFSITPAQGRMKLLEMVMLSKVRLEIDNSTDEALTIFWEYALSWDRNSPHVKKMAWLLGMNDEQTDTFFTEANKI